MKKAQYLRQCYYENGMTQEAIAREMGKTKQWVSQLFQGHGIVASRKPRLERLFGDNLKSWLFDCLERGLTGMQIAEEAGSSITAGQVYSAIYHFGLPAKKLRLPSRFWSKVNMAVASSE